MGHQANPPSTSHEDFFLALLTEERYAQDKHNLQRYTTKLAVEIAHLHVDDAEDIFWISIQKYWKAYISPQATRELQIQDDIASSVINCLKQIIKNTAFDLNRKNKRMALGIILIELDSLIQSEVENSVTKNELVGDRNTIKAESLMTQLDLDDFFSTLINPLHQFVWKYLMGEVNQKELDETFKNYSRCYLRRVVHEIKKAFCKWLETNRID